MEVINPMETLEVEMLEKRLTAVEELIRTGIHQNGQQVSKSTPAWKGIIGVFKDDPLFDEAERLGREWRDTQIEDYDTHANSPS